MPVYNLLSVKDYSFPLNKVETFSRSERKYIEALQQKKYRDQERKFLIEGFKLFFEAIDAHFPMEKIYISETALIKILPEKQKNLFNNIIVLKDSEMKSISSLKNPEGIVALTKIPDTQFSNELPDLSPFMYLWEINDPGNLGTILRTARWFGIKNILLSPNSVDPYSPKVVRGSMGALFNISVWQNVNYEDLRDYSHRHNISILCADVDGGQIEKQRNSHWGLILGSESHGLPGYILKDADSIMSIQKPGSGESLNLSVSAGIILNDLIQK